MRAERRRAASKVATDQAVQRTACILEQMADQNVTVETEFRILTMNASAERGFGVPRISLIGRTHRVVFPASAGSHAAEQYRRAMRVSVVRVR